MQVHRGRELVTFFEVPEPDLDLHLLVDVDVRSALIALHDTHGMQLDLLARPEPPPGRSTATLPDTSRPRVMYSPTTSLVGP